MAPVAQVDAVEPSFSKEIILLGNKKIEVEVARTEAQQARGLMFRKSPLGENHGMLFVYKTEKVLNFWMKNTFIPLSIGFFDQQKKLLEIHDMKPMKSVMQLEIDRSRSTQKAMYALEVDQGWFKKQGVSPGQKFKFLKKSRP